MFQINNLGDNIRGNKYVVIIGSKQFSMVKFLICIFLLLLVLLKIDFVISFLEYLLVDTYFVIPLILSFFIFRSFRMRLFTICLSSLILVIVTLYLDFFKQTTNIFNIGFWGYYEIDKNGIASKNDNTKYLESKTCSNLTEKMNMHFSFRTKRFKLLSFKYPVFLLKLFGSHGLNQIIQSWHNDRNIISFYYTVSANKIQLNIIPNSNVFTTPFYFNSLASELTKISSCVLTEDFITISSSFLLSIIGQTDVPYLKKENNWGLAHSAISDSYKLIMLTQNINFQCQNSKDFQNLLQYWQVNYLREHTKIYLMEKDYDKAVELYCKSFGILPTFPYSSYDIFKKEYERLYYQGVANWTNEISKHVDTTQKSDSDKYQEVSIPEMSKVGFLIDDYLNFPVNYVKSIYNCIISQNNTRSPLNWFLLSQLIKYIPEGNSRDEKFRMIYVNRLDLTMKYLDKVIQLDDNFKVVLSKKASYEFLLNTLGYKVKINPRDVGELIRQPKEYLIPNNKN